MRAYRIVAGVGCGEIWVVWCLESFSLSPTVGFPRLVSFIASLPRRPPTRRTLAPWVVLSFSRSVGRLSLPRRPLYWTWRLLLCGRPSPPPAASFETPSPGRRRSLWNTLSRPAAIPLKHPLGPAAVSLRHPLWAGGGPLRHPLPAGGGLFETPSVGRRCYCERPSVGRYPSPLLGI